MNELLTTIGMIIMNLLFYFVVSGANIVIHDNVHKGSFFYSWLTGGFMFTVVACLWLSGVPVEW